MNRPETWDDETLMSFADGELPPERAAEVAEAVADDPALAARVARFRAVRGRLADLDVDAPDAGALMTRAKAAVAAQDRRRPAAWPMALAAGIAGLAIGAGLMTTPLATDPLTADPLGAGMAARGPLRAALDRTPSGGAVTEHGTRVAVIYTLVTDDGRACRAFRRERDGRAYEGVACREDGAWRMLVIARARPPVGGFAQAATQEPAAVTGALEALVTGGPLTVAQESALMRRGWRAE